LTAAQPRGAAARRYALLLLGVVGLSAAGIFYSLAHAPAMTMVAYRCLFAALLVLPLLAIPRRGAQTQALAPIRRSDLALSIVAGAIFAIDLTLWAVGLHYTSVSSAMLMVSTDPIWIALFGAIFFAEKPKLLGMAGIAVAVAGTAVVAGMDIRISGSALLGDALALAAAMAETWYFLIGRRVRARVDTARYATIVYISCALCTWLMLSATHYSPVISVHDVWLAVALALVVTVMGHTLISRSLGYMPAAVVAVCILSQPLIAAVLAFIFLHQTVPLTTAIGGLIALAGIGLVAYANERASPGIDGATVV
jgi:drug/metabolite transporter (DMT)-like permease